jgi:integrase
MPVRLTETAITKAVREVSETDTRRDLADAGCPGLRLRLTPAGGKSWVLACRDRLGRMRRFPVGNYPDMGLSEARDEARAMHAKVKGGADPVADRRRDRAIGRDAKVGIGTLAAVLDIYEAHKGKTLKSWPHSRKRVDLVFKPLMSRPVAALTAADLQMTADAYPAVQSAAFAVRTIRPALKWAVQRRHVPASLAELEVPATVNKRTRVLSRDELAALLPALRACAKPHAALIRLLLLTLTRLNEAAGARWRDVDLDAGTWTIHETKNGEPHTVPLSKQAAELLRTIHAVGIPQKRKGRRKRGEASVEPLPPLPLKPEDLIFRTDRGTALGNWDRETKTLQEASKTGGWHRHDLRRTGATMLGEMGELPDIVEAALNHTAIHSPLAATYNRSRYRPQVAAALQRLADALDGIEKGSAEVVPLHRSVG